MRRLGATFISTLGLVACTAFSSSNDGPGLVDAGADTSTDASELGFCDAQSPAPFFCADFDESSGTRAYREGVSFALPPALPDQGAAASITPSGRSLPNALELATGAVADAAKQQARLEKPVAQGPTDGARLRFDLLLQEIGQLDNTGIATIQLRDPAGGETLSAFVVLRSGGAMTVSLSTADAGAPGTTTMPQAGTWTTVDLEVRLGPTVTAVLRLDGTVRAETSGPSPFANAAGSDFYLGLSTTGPSAPIRIAIDNVLFTPR